MTKTITFLLATLLAITAFGQTFEGVIIYKNTYKSKIPSVKDEQFTTMMGSTQEYYIKDGDYKSVMNGSVIQWQLYVNKDNKIYNKMATSETLLWYDGSVNNDSIISYSLNKDVIEILGYKCDEIVFVCKSGTQKYYFNHKLKVDVKFFEKHTYGNWYNYLKQSNSFPLKMIVDNQQFTMESIATDIKEMKLDKSVFEIPANTQTMKSPY